jgi:hypothetical protein
MGEDAKEEVVEKNGTTQAEETIAETESVETKQSVGEAFDNVVDAVGDLAEAVEDKIKDTVESIIDGKETKTENTQEF